MFLGYLTEVDTKFSRVRSGEKQQYHLKQRQEWTQKLTINPLHCYIVLQTMHTPMETAFTVTRFGKLMGTK
jgi:hypothetical protein